MIEDYIDYISLKRKELGGHAICPFAKSFLNKVEIIESTDFWGDAIRCMDNKEHPMLYLIYGDKDQYDVKWLESFCSTHEKYAKDKDLWLIWDHPNQINKINNVETNKKQISDKKVNFGFYNSLLLLIVVIIIISRGLYFFQDFITQNLPFTEFYFDYFFESMRNIFEIFKNLISSY